MVDLVTEYSHLLASQGELQMAFDYLELVAGGDNAASNGLKSRLAVALRIARRPPGVAAAAAAAAAPTGRQPSAPASHHRSVVGNRSRQSSREIPRGSVCYESRGSVSHNEHPPVMTPSVPSMAPMMTPGAPIMTPPAPIMTPSMAPVAGPPPSAFNPAAHPMAPVAVAPPMAPPVATVDPAAAAKSAPPKRSGLTGRPRYAAHPDVVGTLNGG